MQGEEIVFKSVQLYHLLQYFLLQALLQHMLSITKLIVCQSTVRLKKIAVTVTATILRFRNHIVLILILRGPSDLVLVKQYYFRYVNLKYLLKSINKVCIYIGITKHKNYSIHAELPKVIVISSQVDESFNLETWYRVSF